MIYKKYLLPDSLWELLQPLIPGKKSTVGRPRSDIKKVANGIFYVILTGIPWKAAPHYFGSPSTLHKYFQLWVMSEVFSKLWLEALIEYDVELGIQWKWRSIDSSSIKAPLGGEKTGANPTDRGKLGTKRSIIVDGRGIPISIEVEGANRHDSKIWGKNLQKTIIDNENNNVYRDYLCGDKAYDSQKIRNKIEDYGLMPKITKRGIDQTSPERNRKPHKKARRWVVERTFSWFNKFGKIRRRTEKKVKNYFAILYFVAAVICLRTCGIVY